MIPPIKLSIPLFRYKLLDPPVLIIKFILISQFCFSRKCTKMATWSSIPVDASASSVSLDIPDEDPPSLVTARYLMYFFNESNRIESQRLSSLRSYHRRAALRKASLGPRTRSTNPSTPSLLDAATKVNVYHTSDI